MPSLQKITPCLLFDTQAEEAANFYVSIFKNSRIVRVQRYIEAGQEIHGKEAGSVQTVEFELDGQRFTALNGGPQFKFNEAISLEVPCETQEEIDFYWEALTQGGEEVACGWLKDRYGLSWQITPAILSEMLSDPDVEKVERVTNAFLKMKKLDIAALEQAYSGQ
jgi:predicted 3-demethylubiquinone-9 3-methyltransferase (glyoxalase superfamily)